jgi:ABC-type branched-subunit amino acid transport system ATPase component
VEHKIDMIMTTSDRVTVLSNGSVLCSGTPLEVGNNPEVHAVYLGSPPSAAGGQIDLVSVST